LSGPPSSPSPRFVSVENSSTATPPESVSRIESSSPIDTLLLKTMLPLLLNAVIWLPILKSPSSLVPEAYTLPPSSETCSDSVTVLPPFCGNAL
jgi:hypothetical protein